ncbi:hypothetical protein THAOC_34501 [Thalassiosira oceanica]|uniref:DUF7495 domain-containing protein n=1 Tax=Thalassiosira oceanica TaxID=159749 RepID=K0R3E7_THAOC|nr:hypothetical protein THAOC_34501 [Thalassiosira oceanica]|eukprot:EJK46815.1 hypothetical protein THAOC_34501 [Thalassiosira oceanica]
MDQARPPPPEDLLDVGGSPAAAGDSAYSSPSRPLQLPRVGWGNGDDEAGESRGTDHESQPESTEIPPTSSCDDSLTHRSLSRTAEGDLMSIPEDVSVHGAWPDYYPDLLSSCYDYDANQKSYRYRRCSPQTFRNVFAILVIVIGAIVGANMRNSRRRHHNSTPSSSWVETDDNYLGGSQEDGPGEEPQEEEGVDLYQAIMDSFHPIMFDDSSEWDGTFFDAYEFCGRQFARVPCPYMAVSANANEATSFSIKVLTISQYCPMGPGHPPLGGVKVTSSASWAPLNSRATGGDDHNDWVALGEENMCQLYSRLHSNGVPPPDWQLPDKVVGRDDNVIIGRQIQIARHVMCCLETVDIGNHRSPEEPSEWMSSDPGYIRRPPSIEEVEAMKPVPIPSSQALQKEKVGNSP